MGQYGKRAPRSDRISDQEYVTITTAQVLAAGLIVPGSIRIGHTPMPGVKIAVWTILDGLSGTVDFEDGVGVWGYALRYFKRGWMFVTAHGSCRKLYGRPGDVWTGDVGERFAPRQATRMRYSSMEGFICPRLRGRIRTLEKRIQAGEVAGKSHADLADMKFELYEIQHELRKRGYYD